MVSLHRIDRKLRVEELEPRIAPAPLVLAGNALKKFTFTDADGDKVLITLSGSKASRVEISDQFGNTPGTAVGSEISLVEFTQANRKTALTIAYASGNTGPRTMPTPVDISGSGLTLGSFVSPGSINTLAADEVRLVSVGGDIASTVSLDLFIKGERIEARDITTTGSVDVTNWLGGTLSLSRNLDGSVSGDNAIPGQITVKGDIGATGQILSTGVVANVLVWGGVAAGAYLNSFTGFGPITVNGAGGFMGTVSAQGSYGITSVTTLGPLGGTVDSTSGPIGTVAVGGDILGTAYIASLGTMNLLRVNGNVLGASMVEVTGNINSVMILGATGLEGSIAATGTIGPVKMTRGGILENPLLLPNLAAGGGFTGTGITIPGDMNGGISAGAGTISSVTIGGSFGSAGSIVNSNGSIGNVTVNGATFAGAVTAGTSITSVRMARASMQDGASIVAGSGIGRIDVLSATGDVQAGAGITQGAVTTAGTGFGRLYVGRHFSGTMDVLGSRGVTGGINIGGNLSGQIVATGPIAAAVTIGGNLTTSGQILGGSAGTLITAPLTIRGNMDGTLGAGGGAKSGAITIMGNVGTSGVIRSVGNLSRNLIIGGSFNGVLQAENTAPTTSLTEGTGHGSVATAQSVTLTPSGTIAGGFITVNEVEPNNYYYTIAGGSTPTVVPSIPATIVGTVSDPGDEDWFRFTAYAGQVIRFDVDAHYIGSPLTAHILLYNSAITQVFSVAGTATTDPTTVYSVPATDTYYLRMRSYNLTTMGDYKIYLQDRSDDVTVVSGSIDTASEEDWYSFAADQQVYVALDVDAANLGSSLRAQIDFANTTGAIIATSNAGPVKGGLDTGGFDPDPILTYSGPNGNTAMYPTVAGTYYVRVKSADGSTGPYRLYVSAGQPAGYKTNEWGTNDTAAQANVVALTSGTPTTISGVIHYTAGNYDEDWYKFYMDMPLSGTYLGLLFDIDTKQYTGGGWSLKSGNLRLTLYGDTAGTVVVYDTNSYTMDNSSGTYGELDPCVFWVPNSAFVDGDYYARVYLDSASASGAAVTPSDTFYNLKITRVYEGINRSAPVTTYGILPEVEQNRYMNIAQDLTFGTGESFVLRDPGSTVDHILAGFALQGLISTPDTAINPYPAGDLDIYWLPAVQGQELKVRLSSPWNTSNNPTYITNCALKIYDSNGVLLAQNDNTNFGQYSVTGASATQVRNYWPSITFVAPRSDNYFIEVSAAESMAPINNWPSGLSYYNLYVTRQGVVVNEATPMIDASATVENSFDVYAGNSQGIAGTISAVGEQDKYTFAVSAGTAVSFSLADRNGSGLDGRLQVWDAGANVLLDNTGFGASGDPMITYNFAKAGLYQIIVSGSTSGTSTGDYLLSMTRTPASITSKITIGGDLNGTAGPGLGLITVPGSVLGSIIVGGDVIGNGKIELGLDLVGSVQLNDLGATNTTGGAQTGNVTGSVYVGGTIRSGSSVTVTGRVYDTGRVFARGVAGGAGPASAALRVTGTPDSWTDSLISPNAELVVAPAGGFTGRGYVYLGNSVSGSYQAVNLYNLDNTGTLNGFYASVTQFAGSIPNFGDKKTYAANHDYTALSVGFGIGSQDVQVQMYYDMDRYHSYMSLLGYGSSLDRVVYADENEPGSNTWTSAFYDLDYAPSVWGFRLTNTNGQSLGSMGDEMLQVYNRAVNEAMIPIHGFLSVATPSASNESQPIEYALADYRAASIMGNPWIGDARTDSTQQDLYNWGFLRLVDNLTRWNTSMYAIWNSAAYRTGGTRLGSEVLSGILWDIRSVTGQYVTDELAMSSLSFLDTASRLAAGNQLVGTIGFYNSTTPDMLTSVLAADQQLYSGIHATQIRQAFAIHGVGSYDFTTKSDAPSGTDYVVYGRPTVPSLAITAGTGVKSSVSNWTVQFDDIVTKLDYGETLEVLGVDGANNLFTVMTYTPLTATLNPTHQAGCDFGRGLQGVTVPVTGAVQVIIRLTPDADSDLSLGFRAFVTDPPGSVSGSGLDHGGITFYGSAGTYSMGTAYAGAGLSGVVGSAGGVGSGLSQTSSSTSALLQSLMGLLPTTGQSSSSVPSATGAVLTVSDIAKASEPVSQPAAAPAGETSVLVYGDIGQATGGASATDTTATLTDTPGFEPPPVGS